MPSKPSTTRAPERKPDARPSREPGESPATSERPAESAGRTLPELPKTRTTGDGGLREKMVVIYGPRGIGKSTLASEWGERVLFFDTAGELDGIPGYKHPVTSWEEFRLASAALVRALDETPPNAEPPYDVVAIDTGDLLGSMVAEYTNSRLGISHASELDWGKGWDTLKSEYQLRLAKLAATPRIGLVVVSHAKEIEIKTRARTFDKWIPTLGGGVRDLATGMADLVLFIDYAESDDDESRVIKTKPSRYHEAKERGRNPILPPEIPWPVGEDGFKLISDAWVKGGGKL